MSRSLPTKPLNQLRRPWPLSPPLPRQPLQPTSHRLPLPHATYTTITTTRCIISVLPGFNQIVAHHAASSVVKKATLCPTALPAPSFNASSTSRRVPAPALRLEDI